MRSPGSRIVLFPAPSPPDRAVAECGFRPRSQLRGSRGVAGFSDSPRSLVTASDGAKILARISGAINSKRSKAPRRPVGSGKEVGEITDITEDDLTYLDRDGALEVRAVEDERMELAVFAAGVHILWEVPEQGLIDRPAGERLIQLFARPRRKGVPGSLGR